MKFTGRLVAASLSVLASGSAYGVWGVKYEVNTGSGWTNAATIDVSGGSRTVDFRISVYHDGAMIVNGTWGPAPAVAPLRLCNSQKITNFGNPGFGDNLLSYTKTVDSANANALVSAQSGADLILGTPNSVYSFAANTQIMIPHPEQLEKQFYAGKILIGNGASGATTRTITLTANSFAFPGATSGSGGTYGGTFFVVRSGNNGNGAADEASTTLSATITVELPACPGDLNDDRRVDDDDFLLFAGATDLFDCAEPSMPAGCPADLTGDGFVDEADFVVFAAAYDRMVCP